MLIQEFERELKEIHPSLHVRRNKADIAGVYGSKGYVGVAIPPSHIFDTFRKDYCDAFGNPYRSRGMAKLLIRLRYKKYV